MKLLIKRDQKSGMFTGKAKFFLYVRAEVTPDEQALIKKCALEDELLVHHEKANLANLDAGTLVGAVVKTLTDTALTTKSLIKGTEFNCKNVAELLGIEAQVVEAGVNLKRYIDAAKCFGGEVIVDIDELSREGDAKVDA